MKTINIEVKSTKVVYEASDGLQFNDIEQCRRYENTFRCAMRSLINGLAIRQTTEYAFFNRGCDDNTVYLLHPKDMDELIRIKQYVASCDGNVDSVKEDFIGKDVVLTVTYGDEYAWAETLDSIVNRMMDFFKVDKK